MTLRPRDFKSLASTSFANRAWKQQSPAIAGLCVGRTPESGAGNETRTRDPDLGKVVLYQLSYSRGDRHSTAKNAFVNSALNLKKNGSAEAEP